MPAGQVHHLDLVVTSLPRSLDFYLGLLGPLGWGDGGTITGERGEHVQYLRLAGHDHSLGLRERQSPADDPPDRYRVGMHHLAFAAPSRDVVDERAEWLRARGVELESGPRDYDYTPGYYAVFFPDPDGLKLEIVHQPS
jgi:glyoxylase I family protein